MIRSVRSIASSIGAGASLSLNIAAFPVPTSVSTILLYKITSGAAKASSTGIGVKFVIPAVSGNYTVRTAHTAAQAFGAEITFNPPLRLIPGNNISIIQVTAADATAAADGVGWDVGAVVSDIP